MTVCAHKCTYAYVCMLWHLIPQCRSFPNCSLGPWEAHCVPVVGTGRKRGWYSSHWTRASPLSYHNQSSSGLKGHKERKTHTLHSTIQEFLFCSQPYLLCLHWQQKHLLCICIAVFLQVKTANICKHKIWIALDISLCGMFLFCRTLLQHIIITSKSVSWTQWWTQTHRVHWGRNRGRPQGTS